jgi:hypothetical protein
MPGCPGCGFDHVQEFLRRSLQEAGQAQAELGHDSDGPRLDRLQRQTIPPASNPYFFLLPRRTI